MTIFLTLFALFVISIIVVTRIIRKKHMHLWLGHYLKRKIFSKRAKVDGPTHIMFAFVDHYEPMWGKDIPYEQECARVDRWYQDYPKAAGKFKDADGCYPKHSFFYPEEEYRKEHLDKITELLSLIHI